MFALTAARRFFLYRPSCDMRKGFHGLSGGLRPGMYFVVLRAAGKRVRAARIFVERGL